MLLVGARGPASGVRTMRRCMATRAGRSGRVLSKSVVEVRVVDASRVACGSCWLSSASRL